MLLVQKCPRCESGRIKRGYKEVPLLSRLAGRNELLCTNCNLEFPGFAVIGTVSRNKVWDPEDMTNRRRVPRFRACAPVKVELVEDFTAEIRAFRGETQDVGRYGMSIRYPVGYSDILVSDDEEERRLKLTLTLPQGVVIMCVKVMYFVPLPHEYATTQVIGTKITQISMDDSRRYSAFINTLRLNATRAEARRKASIAAVSTIR